MVWLEDPLCGDVAHRGVLEEEDEQTAQELAAQYMVEPVVQVGGKKVLLQPDRPWPPCRSPTLHPHLSLARSGPPVLPS
jgi:hypothetical protein